MKKTYEQVMSQISALQVEAEALRRTEMDGVVKRIREAIVFYKLTAADLGLVVPRKHAAGDVGPFKRSRVSKAAPQVKYQHSSGGTWGGLGKRPQWLRDELAAGKTLDEFLVK